MNSIPTKNIATLAMLAMLMAVTRFNHFGSSIALPDASYAVFFLAGLFLGRMRGAVAVLVLLLVEAALVDYYAINFRDVSSWCVTSAYGFLMVAYAALWFIGRWYAARHNLSGKGMLGLLAVSVAAGSLAFVIANVSFYLLAGYFGSMSFTEFALRVAQYYSSYVEVTVLYIGCALIVQMVYSLLAGKAQREINVT